MQKELDYKDSQFRNGKYEGSLIFMAQGLPSDEKVLTLEVDFADGKVTGKGESQYCGKYALASRVYANITSAQVAVVLNVRAFSLNKNCAQVFWAAHAHQTWVQKGSIHFCPKNARTY